MSKVVLLISTLIALPVFGALEIKDEEGKHLDVLSDGKVVARYMYEHDVSSKDRHHETYKPFLHVFDAGGKKPITKGAGGQFTHHRGIFIGWNRIGFDGKSYDRWHMKGGDIVHQKFTKKEIRSGAAVVTSVTHWMDEKNEAFLEEERSMIVNGSLDDGRVFIHFHSELTPMRGDVSLKGDPEHAGVHFRPADEVDLKLTKYLYPEGVTDVKKEKDLPWVAENFTVDGKEYGVVHLNHSNNPKGTRHSAYRDYGRFGAFFEKDIKQGESLEIEYGFVILEGKLPDRETIQKVWEGWGK